MRSVPSPAESDLTAKAKIRNAASFREAKLRAIAAAAGVSVGLIAHHFGSKDGTAFVTRATCTCCRP